MTLSTRSTCSTRLKRSLPARLESAPYQCGRAGAHACARTRLRAHPLARPSGCFQQGSLRSGASPVHLRVRLTPNVPSEAELLRCISRPYRFDAAGRRISLAVTRDARPYRFDAAGRLISLAVARDARPYRFDAAVLRSTPSRGSHSGGILSGSRGESSAGRACHAAE